MAIGQVAVSYKTKNRRMPLKSLKTRAFQHTPDESSPYFAGINCIKDNVEIDPCMGSGHILVYAFDVLMQIYRMAGYSDRDAARLILEKNLYGLDIDRRAYQLAYFALMMKARQYNRRVFTENIRPQVYHPAGWSDGEEYGSLLKIDYPGEKPDYIHDVENWNKHDDAMRVWNFKRLLAQKYDVVVTNPPYRQASELNTKCSNFIKANYPDSKSDMFATFIERCAVFIKANGYQAMITQRAWMFLSSYEKLRNKLKTQDVVNMAHLGTNAFPEIKGEVVQATTFVMSGRHFPNFKGVYVHLVDTNDADGKEREFLSGNNRYTADSDNFAKIPGSPVAYWVGEAMLRAFEHNVLRYYADPKRGMCTCANELFYKNWYEVSYSEIGFTISKTEKKIDNYTYVPLNKGGSFRKWYGNLVEVVYWKHNGVKVKAYPTAQIKGEEYYFLPAITWSSITSGTLSFRYTGTGFIFDQASNGVFPNHDIYYFLGLLCSNVAMNLLSIVNPSMNLLVGDIASLPVVISNGKKEVVNAIVTDNISLSHTDWDAFETSWDFKHHPLIGGRSIASAFAAWERECDERFNTLKANEEELNRIFIDIYGLQDELTPEVEDKDVTVRLADLEREIRSLISYAVGCMFGRYSLDVEGLAYAGGEWGAGKYNTFIPDADNVLPICDDEYFDDDICGRFVEFVRTVCGADTLEENLRFIADALGGSGTPREIIRKYFISDFYKDHCKIYQKRPIYWLFDSGKKNGFKALVYLHRYRSDLLAKLRTDYVHEQQERYRTQLKHISDALNAASGAERAKLLKQQEKFTAQAAEISAFEEKIHHLADMHISLDLDDGVKVNYAKFGDVLAKI